jgi:hypothetical protein
MPLNNYAWIASAVIAWIIFFLLVDWSRIKYTVWGGFITVALQLLVDTGRLASTCTGWKVFTTY